jgi:hypothetical protein
MISATPHKTHYSELEVANALGVSIDELRRLIRHHIVRGEDELPSLSQASFQPSDLLLLRILAGQPTGSC